MSDPSNLIFYCCHGEKEQADERSETPIHGTKIFPEVETPGNSLHIVSHIWTHQNFSEFAPDRAVPSYAVVINSEA